MKQTTILTITLLTITLQVQSIETVLPLDAIDYSERILADVYSQPPWADYFNIYNLEVNNDYVYSMVGRYYQGGAGAFNYPVFSFCHAMLYMNNIKDKTVSYVPSQYVSSRISNTDNTKNSAIFYKTELFLEDSYIPYTISDNDIYTCYSYSINRLASYNTNSGRKLIGGLIEWTTSSTDGHNVYETYTVNFWKPDGKHIWSKNIKKVQTDKVTYGLPAVTELRFTPNGQFLTFNLGGECKYIDDLPYMAPYSYLIDTETFTFLLANRDVEFTSDEKYYVTERDGLPSLVDAETHDVLLRYDPGSTMTACGFSPDDAKLYIACEDLKVYEFSSHVPDTAVKDWAIFE